MRRFAKPLYGLTPVPRVRIPASPPYSLNCRENERHSPEICEKLPHFCDFPFETGPEKVSCGAPDASPAAFFSGGQIRSPVSATPLSECKAITN